MGLENVVYVVEWGYDWEGVDEDLCVWGDK